MIALLQRVSQASVSVGGEEVGVIEKGLLVFLGVEKGDAILQVGRMAEKIAGYRVFPDANEKMNLSVRDIQGGVLLVPQFTLAADTSKGMRPSFHSAAAPDFANTLFDQLHMQLVKLGLIVAKGVFGADMKVSLINDGPVTFSLSVDPTRNSA